MVAIDPEETGGPEVLKLVTRPIPKPGAGEYLIQVAAAGVSAACVLEAMPVEHAMGGAFGWHRFRNVCFGVWLELGRLVRLTARALPAWERRRLRPCVGAVVHAKNARI